MQAVRPRSSWTVPTWVRTPPTPRSGTKTSRSDCNPLPPQGGENGLRADPDYFAESRCGPALFVQPHHLRDGVIIEAPQRWWPKLVNPNATSPALFRSPVRHGEPHHRVEYRVAPVGELSPTAEAQHRQYGHHREGNC
jgi:hypothetical protein